MTERVEIPTDAGPMPADLFPATDGGGAGTRPGVVVVVQEIFGVTDYVLDRAADLAASGYDALVPHLFWRHGDTVVEGDDDAALGRAMGLASSLDWDTAVADTRAALALLRDRGAGGVGLVGFCWGGGIAFDAASRESDDVAALVAYYASGLPGLLERAPGVTAPSLHHWGTEDAFISREQVAEIEAAVVREGVRLERYEGAGHAFDNPFPRFHHVEASALAWDRTLRLLADSLDA
ncbi:MAG: dienelactone hydrolase family protein [Actinomycetaceae bacterium]